MTKVTSSSFRIQTTTFKFPCGDFLLINCYFPCDPRKDSYDDSELTKVLADIRSIILTSQCNNILLAGDLNCHFDRQNSFTTTIADAFEDLGISFLWNMPDDDPNHFIQSVDYTYLSSINNCTSCSTIDHFGVNANLYLHVKEAGVIHNGENLSNHSAIYVKIHIGDVKINNDLPQNAKIISWTKATTDAKENFKSELANKLSMLELPNCIQCFDFNCNVHSHSSEIEDYTINVLEAMESASRLCLPSFSTSNKGKPRKGILPGWNEYVKPYADENIFWNAVWKSEFISAFGS